MENQTIYKQLEVDKFENIGYLDKLQISVNTNIDSKVEVLLSNISDDICNNGKYAHNEDYKPLVRTIGLTCTQTEKLIILLQEALLSYEEIVDEKAENLCGEDYENLGPKVAVVQNNEGGFTVYDNAKKTDRDILKYYREKNNGSN